MTGVTRVKPVSGDLVKLSETVLGSDASDITITGLPTGYRDLIVRFAVRSTRASADDTFFRCGNGSIDTGSHYSTYSTYAISGNGTVNNDSTQGYLAITPGANRSASIFAKGEVTLYDYLSAEWKMMLGEAFFYERAIEAYTTQPIAIAWNQTAVIDQIRIYPGTGPNLKAGSFAALYGRK